MNIPQYIVAQLVVGCDVLLSLWVACCVGITEHEQKISDPKARVIGVSEIAWRWIMHVLCVAWYPFLVLWCPISESADAWGCVVFLGPVLLTAWIIGPVMMDIETE